jgi:hypothetical protein
MRRSNALLAAAALALVSAAPGRADPYHNTEYHFRVDLPPGWTVLSAEELRRTNAVLEKMFPGMEVTMVAGFQPRKGDFVDTGCVLVQVDRRVTNKTSFEELERELKRDVPASRRGEPEATLRLVRRIIYDVPTFDHERGRYTLTGIVPIKPGKVYMSSVGYLGPDGLVILHGFTRVGGARSELDPFTQLSDSFRFEEPEKPRSVLDRVFGDQIGQVGRMAIIGGVIAVLVVIIGALGMREKPRAPRWPN